MYLIFLLFVWMKTTDFSILHFLPYWILSLFVIVFQQFSWAAQINNQFICTLLQTILSYGDVKLSGLVNLCAHFWTKSLWITAQLKSRYKLLNLNTNETFQTYSHHKTKTKQNDQPTQMFSYAIACESNLSQISENKTTKWKICITITNNLQFRTFCVPWNLLFSFD